MSIRPPSPIASQALTIRLTNLLQLLGVPVDFGEPRCRISIERSRRRILCGPKKLDRMSTAIRGAHLLYFELRGPGEFEKILTMVSMWRISSEITSKSLFLADERSSVRSMVKSRILTRCERVPDTVGNTPASCRSGQVFRTGGGARGSAGVVS